MIPPYCQPSGPHILISISRWVCFKVSNISYLYQSFLVIYWVYASSICIFKMSLYFVHLLLHQCRWQVCPWFLGLRWRWKVSDIMMHSGVFDLHCYDQQNSTGLLKYICIKFDFWYESKWLHLLIGLLLFVCDACITFCFCLYCSCFC